MCWCRGGALPTAQSPTSTLSAVVVANNRYKRRNCCGAPSWVISTRELPPSFVSATWCVPNLPVRAPTQQSCAACARAARPLPPNAGNTQPVTLTARVAAGCRCPGRRVGVQRRRRWRWRRWRCRVAVGAVAGVRVACCGVACRKCRGGRHIIIRLLIVDTVYVSVGRALKCVSLFHY